VQRILTIADEEIEQAIKTAITQLAALAADYYGRLIRGSPFTDVELVYKHARSGQVEFSLTFDGRHPGVSPPQRTMSTSHLNALGLALHLARLKLDVQPWRTLSSTTLSTASTLPIGKGSPASSSRSSQTGK
jgi:hypothetical protein